MKSTLHFLSDRSVFSVTANLAIVRSIGKNSELFYLPIILTSLSLYVSTLSVYLSLSLPIYPSLPFSLSLSHPFFNTTFFYVYVQGIDIRHWTLNVSNEQSLLVQLFLRKLKYLLFIHGTNGKLHRQPSLLLDIHRRISVFFSTVVVIMTIILTMIIVIEAAVLYDL